MARTAGVRTRLIRAGATVIGGGFAGLGGATLVLAQVGTFAAYLNTLTSTLIPQTAGFNQVPAGAEGAFEQSHTPAQASIDLIYEIGSATSQGDGSRYVNGSNVQGNFFLRQNAQGADVCGLVTVPPCTGGPAAASASHTRA